MSKFSYDVSREIDAMNPPFDALIMAAMRKADDNNMDMLKDCWPELHRELQARYNSPGGILPEEVIARKELEE